MNTRIIEENMIQLDFDEFDKIIAREVIAEKDSEDNIEGDTSEDYIDNLEVTSDEITCEEPEELENLAEEDAAEECNTHIECNSPKRLSRKSKLIKEAVNYSDLISNIASKVGLETLEVSSEDYINNYSDIRSNLKEKIDKVFTVSASNSEGTFDIIVFDDNTWAVFDDFGLEVMQENLSEDSLLELFADFGYTEEMQEECVNVQENVKKYDKSILNLYESKKQRNKIVECLLVDNTVEAIEASLKSALDAFGISKAEAVVVLGMILDNMLNASEEQVAAPEFLDGMIGQLVDNKDIQDVVKSAVQKALEGDCEPIKATIVSDNSEGIEDIESDKE